MPSNSALRLLVASAAAAVLLVGCSAPAADPTTPVDDPVTPVGGACPTPATGGGLAAADDAATVLGTELPEGWCWYKSIEYTTWYAIPAEPDPDFATTARAALEPAGWAFDPADDDSPQWSWITAYPEASAALFTDGAVDGSIFVSDELSADDISSYSIWYGELFSSFGEWEPGDAAQIVGFW